MEVCGRYVCVYVSLYRWPVVVVVAVVVAIVESTDLT